MEVITLDSSLLDLLKQITLFDLILVVSLIIIIVGVLITQKNRIKKLLNKWRKDKNDEEDFNQLVYDLKDSVEEIRLTMKQYKENCDQDREAIKNLTEIVVKMEEKNSKTQRAELKEKIERIYSECHPAQKCTDMQFETLKDLIEEYEAHGGVNSFVHTTVEPEMYEWARIKKIRE